MKKGVVVFLVLITLFSQLILSQIDCTFSSMKEYCHESGDIVYEYLIDRPDLEGCFYGIMPKERCGAGCEESGCIVIPCSSDNGCSRGMMCDPEKQICISKKSCRLTDECRYDETCEGGYCRKIECCGILRNHTCSKFKCCEDSDCPGNMNCISEFNTCGYVPACTAMVENGRSDEILDICLISDNMMEIESFTKTSLDTAGLNIWGYVLPSMDIKKLAENETLALE
ncbi:hypothetical protein JXC34_02290, partial [Candidatus Woesearchaeota archaeon]|nr:hypothetical protein [Candidatus Woesearchaeota archaeon]